MAEIAAVIDPSCQAPLQALGERLRVQRKELRVSATAAAEAAGVSRVTLHRVERGEPSVSMGAYMAVVQTLGLQLNVLDPQLSARAFAAKDAAALPQRIELAGYAQLQALAWQLNRAVVLTPQEALDLYERNWRHVDAASMTPHERSLLNALVRTLGGGRLLV